MEIGRERGHPEIGGIVDPEDWVPVEHQIAERAAAHAGDAGDQDEAENIELRARGGERPGEAEDEHGGEIQRLNQGHAPSPFAVSAAFAFFFFLGLNGFMPSRASA